MRRWWHQANPAARARFICAMAALVVILILIVAPKPWDIPLDVAKKIKLQNLVRVYSWWAGLLNLIPLALLAMTAGWWTQPARPIRSQRAPSPKWFWPVVGAALLLCAMLNAPRLTHSLWDDEEYSVRRAIVGAYQEKDDGTVKFKKLPWLSTLWYYSKPTNHILQSITARVSNSLWQSIAKPEGLQFWEPALRLPSFLAGLAAIGVVAAVLRRLGYPAAGALAAVLLALHPWYARFVPEARGYTFIFLFLSLQWLFFIRAAETAQWRWWAGFALAQFAMLWTWPASATIAAVTSLSMAAWCFFQRGDRPSSSLLLGRWFAVSCLCGMAIVQLLMPCLPQFTQYLKDATHLPMDGFWLKNEGCLLVTGSHWSKTGRLDFRYPELFPVVQSYSWVAVLLFTLAILFLGLGAIRLLRDRRSAGVVFPALWLLPGIAVYLFARLKGYYLFEWYLSFMVPGLIALAALGMTFLYERASRRPALRIGSLAFLFVLVAGYAALTHPQRHFLISRSVQGIRESVLATRPSLNPQAPRNQRILTVSTILSPSVYDPLVQVAPSVESLAELLADADRKGLPCFLNQGCPSILKIEFPATYAMITDESLFEVVADFPGIEEMLDRVVFRYRPGSIAGKDLSTYGTNPPFNRAFIY